MAKNNIESVKLEFIKYAINLNSYSKYALKEIK